VKAFFCCSCQILLVFVTAVVTGLFHLSNCVVCLQTALDSTSIAGCMHLKQLSTSAASDQCIWLADTWAHQSPENLVKHTVTALAALCEEIALIPCLRPMMLTDV